MHQSKSLLLTISLIILTAVFPARTDAQIPKDSLVGTYRYYWSSGIEFRGITDTVYVMEGADTVEVREEYQCVALSPKVQVTQTLLLDRKGKARWAEEGLPLRGRVSQRGHWRMKKGRLYVTLTHDSEFRRPGIPGVSMMLVERRLPKKVKMTFILEEHPGGFGVRPEKDQEKRLERIKLE